MFQGKRFITRGVGDNVPLEVQMFLWSLLDNLIAKRVVELDYLQVFELCGEGSKQKIIHSQEVPEYRKRQSKTTYFITSRPEIMFSGGIIIMKPTAKSQHRRYSVAEKSSLLEAYKTSGALKKQWCTENNIGLSTLQKWLCEDKKQKQPPNVQTWVPVITITLEKSDKLPVQIGKFTIPVDQHTDMQLLSSVLKVVIGIC